MKHCLVLFDGAAWRPTGGVVLAARHQLAPLPLRPATFAVSILHAPTAQYATAQPMHQARSASSSSTAAANAHRLGQQTALWRSPLAFNPWQPAGLTAMLLHAPHCLLTQLACSLA